MTAKELVARRVEGELSSGELLRLVRWPAHLKLSLVWPETSDAEPARLRLPVSVLCELVETLETLED